MKAAEDLRLLIASVIQGLCKKPEFVKVECIESGGKTVLFVVNCDNTDVSLVIGRGGRNIKALRDLTWAIAAKNDLKLTLIVNE